MGKVRKWHPPFFLLAVWMALVDKTVNTVTDAKITLVVLSVMFIGDLALELKERREEGILSVILDDWGRRLWKEGRHIRDGNRRRCGVIELDEVALFLWGKG